MVNSMIQCALKDIRFSQSAGCPLNGYHLIDIPKGNSKLKHSSSQRVNFRTKQRIVF